MSSANALSGIRVQIAGSASASADPTYLAYAHAIVADLTRDVLGRDAGFALIGVEEPVAGDGCPIVFEWTVLETVAKAISRGSCDPAPSWGPRVLVATTEKDMRAFPPHRADVLDALSTAGALELVHLPPGWKEAGSVRERVARRGDALVVLGGGEGVEHLARLYRARSLPVVPLDLSLRDATETGAWGARLLYRKAITEPRTLFDHADPGVLPAMIAGISTRGEPQSSDVSSRVAALLEEVVARDAFYVRLLDPAHADFEDVERHFRDVVDPVVAGMGLRPVEMGSARPRSAFLNVDIFEYLERSSAVVVDLTGLRPNCMIEMGFALGLRKPTIVMARAGTGLPFDTQAVATLFWAADAGAPERRSDLRTHWSRNFDRPPPGSATTLA